MAAALPFGFFFFSRNEDLDFPGLGGAEEADDRVWEGAGALFADADFDF